MTLCRERTCVGPYSRLSPIVHPAVAQKPLLRLLLGKTEGPFVGSSGFNCSPQSPAEIRPRRVRQMVVPQIAQCEDGVDEHKTRQRTVAHRHRDSAVQFDYGRRIGPHEHVVERDDLSPVRGGGVRRPGSVSTSIVRSLYGTRAIGLTDQPESRSVLKEYSCSILLRLSSGGRSEAGVSAKTEDGVASVWRRPR
jgi:hypothetical protein